MTAGELDELGTELLAARREINRAFDDALARVSAWTLPTPKETTPCKR